MKSANAQGGYTIVEVMIFLAVTSALFLVAMVAINGRQAQTEFAQGARDFHSRIDDIINDASNGNFPTTPNLTCNVSGDSAPNVNSDSGSPKDQGTNQDCINMGKVVQLKINSKDLSLYTVVGRRQTSAKNDVSNFGEAKPVAAIGGGLVEQQTIQGDIEPTDIIVKRGPVIDDNYGAIGFFTSFGDKDLNNNKVSFGDVIVVPLISNQKLASTEMDIVNAIDALATTPPAGPPDAIVVCLQQGGAGNGGKRAAIVIGSRGQQTTTDIRLDNIDDFVSIALYGSTGWPNPCPA